MCVKKTSLRLDVDHGLLVCDLCVVHVAEDDTA